jgi:DNA replication protein DnaC
LATWRAYSPELNPVENVWAYLRSNKLSNRVFETYPGTAATILEELGYVPFTAVGGELLFEVLSRRYERGSTLITSNLPFYEWTSVFGSERLCR